MKQLPLDASVDRIGRRGEPFDLAVSGWALPSTDPAQVLGIFDGSTIRPTDNSNFSYFNAPH